MVRLPRERIQLDNILLQTKKEIQGNPDSWLVIRKNSILMEPLKPFRHNMIRQTTSKESMTKKPNFIFREVNFHSFDLDKLMVLQNKEADIWVVFEDCYFQNERYYTPHTKGTPRLNIIQVTNIQFCRSEVKGPVL